MKEKLDYTRLPEPVFDEKPEFVELYWKTWDFAWKNVVEIPGMPQEKHMSEGFADDRIWIWDTCFMVHFCKYAPDVFPGIESFENFYQPMYDNASTTCRIHHPDNPPLFAWIEYEYYKFTGDSSRIERIISEKRYLQRHYEFMENLESGSTFPWGIIHTNFKKLPLGYMWSGNPSGMDNTPRGRDNYDSILWLDAISQQALSALYIAKLAKLIGNDKDEKDYLSRYEELKEIINNNYWSEEDSTYYDIHISLHDFCKVLTPASFWPLIAEVASSEQAEKLVRMSMVPGKLNGDVPWPSVAFDDPDFEPKGQYWRGGVWLPTAYMATKALEKYSYFDIAAETAERLLDHMSLTYKDYSPHTIWECYSPVAPKPSTKKQNEGEVRPDFCGWSALGPISMLIENILGFYDIDAIAKKVKWYKHKSGRHGIKRLRFGDIETDIIADNNQVIVNTNQAFSLEINGKEYSCQQGETSAPIHK